MSRQLSAVPICAFLALAFAPLGTAGEKRAKAEDSSPLPLAERLEVVLPFGLVLLGAAVVAGRRRREDEVGGNGEGPATLAAPEREVERAEPSAVAEEEVEAPTPVEDDREVPTPPEVEVAAPAIVEQDHWGWLDEVTPEPTVASPPPETVTVQPQPVEDVADTRPEEPPPDAQPQPQLESAFLLFVETVAGYEILEGHGSPPQVGGAVELADGNGGARFVVTRMGPSPFPDDPRRCAYLERQVFAVD